MIVSDKAQRYTASVSIVAILCRMMNLPRNSWSYV